MTKQLAKTPKSVALTIVEAGAPTVPETTPQSTAVPVTEQTKTLYVKATTTDLDPAKKGQVVGSRIVDMYHFGTRNWLHNHMWWAMHNGHLVEIEVASADDIETYLKEQRAKLVEKFNGTTH